MNDYTSKASNHIDKKCLNCGKHYTVSLFNIKQDWCSSTCYGEYKLLNRVQRVCEVCETPFITDKESTKQRCSNRCEGAIRCGRCNQWMMDDRYELCKMCRPKQFNFRRYGIINKPYRKSKPTFDYGRNWQKQREKVFTRDENTCQHCGTKFELRMKSFEVHHIRKFRSFNGDWKTANQLTNLITLCYKCHKKAERGLIVLQVKML